MVTLSGGSFFRRQKVRGFLWFERFGSYFLSVLLDGSKSNDNVGDISQFELRPVSRLFIRMFR